LANSQRGTKEKLFPFNIRQHLENTIGEPERAEHLIQRYIAIINSYRLDMLNHLAVEAGKFVEEFVGTVGALENINIKNLIKVRNKIDEIKKELNKKDDKKRKEKQIMLEIAYYSIYALRNTRDAAHANLTPISPWDARHIVDTATWLLEEFLRIYGNLSKNTIESIFYPFSTATTRMLKVIEIIDGKVVPLVDKLSIKEQVLLVLISIEKDCLSPKEIINMLPNVKPNSVYSTLRSLVADRLVVKIGKRNGCYKITNNGKKFIHNKIELFVLNN